MFKIGDIVKVVEGGSCMFFKIKQIIKNNSKSTCFLVSALVCFSIGIVGFIHSKEINYIGLVAGTLMGSIQLFNAYLYRGHKIS